MSLIANNKLYDIINPLQPNQIIGVINILTAVGTAKQMDHLLSLELKIIKIQALYRGYKIRKKNY